jgi:hypothetical protein
MPLWMVDAVFYGTAEGLAVLLLFGWAVLPTLLSRWWVRRRSLAAGVSDPTKGHVTPSPAPSSEGMVGAAR